MVGAYFPDDKGAEGAPRPGPELPTNVQERTERNRLVARGWLQERLIEERRSQPTHLEVKLAAQIDELRRFVLDAHEGIDEYAATMGATGVWHSWRDQMLAQGREVAAERMRWDTLPDRDKQLDAAIARDVVIDFIRWLCRK